MNNSRRLTRETIVKNELGMHARPAAKIAQIAKSAHSDIWLYANSTKADATSILDILTLGALKGTPIVIEIETHKDRVFLDQIVDFFETGFGEK